jgi:hypothetical protein
VFYSCLSPTYRICKIVNLFTGYFNPAHANEKQRLMSLQAYAGGYLDDKLVELSANEVLGSTYDPTFSKPKKAQSFETLQPASLPKGDIIKVIRPQPRPLRRSHKKKEPAVEVENSVMDVLPIESDPLEYEAAESSEVDESDYSVIGRKRRVSYSVPVLSPSPEPTNPVTELLEIATDSITEFLENCYLSMVHCAPALRRAGVIKKDHLLGMARWSDDTLRNWLKKNDIACNALEEEALIIGFSVCISQGMRVLSDLFLSASCWMLHVRRPQCRCKPKC